MKPHGGNSGMTPHGGGSTATAPMGVGLGACTCRTIWHLVGPIPPCPVHSPRWPFAMPVPCYPHTCPPVCSPPKYVQTISTTVTVAVKS